MKNDTGYLEFYEKLESPFSLTDGELWGKIEQRSTAQKQVKIFQINWTRYAAAAVVLILLGTTLFMKFYTNTILSEKGEHLSHMLPDGSTIHLNAETSVSYNLYWWNFNREISLSGEAYFDVVEEEKFTIVSENGVTEIFGTTFNIYARDEQYRVFCESGKVKVSSTVTDINFVLEAGELAVIDNLNKDGRKTEVNVNELLAWKDNRFVFTSIPLLNVTEEFERQYDVSINIKINNLSRLLYTGNFDKTPSVESALEIVCKSFGLTFVKTKNKTYNIVE
ncbi:MAG: FecR family protein [Melioribacteraceae bacterium]|nr:FecR family protein [Melioribacteraceae bacterium]